MGKICDEHYKPDAEEKDGGEDRGVVQKPTCARNILGLDRTKRIADLLFFVDNAAVARASAELNAQKPGANGLGLARIGAWMVVSVALENLASV